MTNTSDPHDPDQKPEEGVAETWQEETPPADDFYDAPEGDEQQAADHEQAVQDAKKKSKANMVFFAVLAVAALIVGGLALSQIFGGSNSGLNDPSAAAIAGGNPLNPADNSARSQNQPIAKQAATNGHGGVDPTVAPTVLSSTIDPTMASALPEPTPALPVAPVPTAPTLSSTQPAAAAAPVMPPVLTPPVAPSQASSTTQPVTAANTAVAVATPAVNKALESRLAQLESQLAALQQGMDRSTQELMQVTMRLNTLPTSSAPVAAGSTPELEQKLYQLQQQVENIAARQQSAPKAAKPAEHQPVSNANARTTSRVNTAVKRQPTQKWVLRAATPESAWVSAGANAPDLKRIAVGDSLPGIGKVKAIRQNGGQWQVIGTAGTVR
jgi:hypothetical protein